LLRHGAEALDDGMARAHGADQICQGAHVGLTPSRAASAILSAARSI
jgi:hypothetical protein